MFFALSVALVGLSASQSLNAQTVDEVLAKYYKAIGGVDAWKKAESMKMSGNLVLVAQGGMTIPMTGWQARPNMKREEGEFNGTKFIEAYDGTTAWRINPFAGAATATKKNEEETKEAAKDMFEDDLIDYAAKGHKVELQGTEEIDGVKAIKLKLTRKSGDERIYFLDPESYLPIMMRSFVTTGPAKGEPSEAYMSDYKNVEGMMTPATTEIKMKGQSQIIYKIDKIEVNPKLDKDLFSFPAK